MAPATEVPAKSNVGVAFAWELCSRAAKITAKATGAVRTRVELCNPHNQRQVLTIWLDGEPGAVLETVEPGTPIALVVDELRRGREYNEFVGVAARSVVEAAFTRASERAS